MTIDDDTKEQLEQCRNQYEQINASLPDADSETDSETAYQCERCHGEVTEVPTNTSPDSKWECEDCAWVSFVEPEFLQQYETETEIDQRYQCPVCGNAVIRIYQTDHDWGCSECAYGSRGEPTHLTTYSEQDEKPSEPDELTGELDGETDEHGRTGVEALHDERKSDESNRNSLASDTSNGNESDDNDPTMDDTQKERDEHIEEALYDAENHIERALYACEDKELRGQLMGVRRSLVVMMTRHFDDVGENDE